MSFLQEFDFPVTIKKDCDYLSSFCNKMNLFISQFESLPNDGSRLFEHLNKYPNQLKSIKESLRKNRNVIIKAFNNYFTGRVATAAKQIQNLILKNARFLVTPIREAHAFLDEEFYTSGKLKELFLFKGRVGEPFCNYNSSEMSHIPLNLRSIVDTRRFSQPGVPCLYLASNSYIVWKELDCPQYDKLCVSAFNINCLDKKIIDLTYSFAKDIYILSDEASVDENVISVFADSISSYPIILACSFVCDETNRKFKSEYVIPQLIMQSLTKIDCVGVAYRSNKIKSDHNLPATNLAIPIYEKNNKKLYGSILKEIDITKPFNLGYFANNIYKKPGLTFHNANGICTKTHMFHPLYPNVHSTFNSFVASLKAAISYDDCLSYTNTLFFDYDEFILFHNRFEAFDFDSKKYN